MSGMINIGIDLGTTNSLIAKFNQGEVEVFKNPNGFKETLPSVVGFRNDRILIGDQARVYLAKDPKRVGARFKRKMGTTETLKVAGETKTPVELSSFILKELKHFVRTGESLDAAVITIPASFDTVQSDATKEAALAAGFQHVVLLQEPIAASLAYANKEKNVDLRNSQWMVYDFGGGTFDVALVKIIEGELTIVDHEGDNYLGGSDFDALIVEQIVVPQLGKLGRFTDLLSSMKSSKGKYNSLWYVLNHRAEEAKIELSSKTSAEIDLGLIGLEDEDGKPVDNIMTITRSELEEVIKPSVDRTTDMMKKILVRNSMRPEDMSFVLMVGGGTYIPFLRKRIEEVLGLKVTVGIDPTNAIVVGAAYYAGTKPIGSAASTHKAIDTGQKKLSVKTVYNRSSQDACEIFTAKIDGDIAGLFYRITNTDGSFDSGLKPVTSRISEDLPLREGAYNIFDLKFFDEQNNVLSIAIEPIQISQGKYSVAGQMLPEDICLVKDSISLNDTVLEKVFSKNAVLPAKSKTTVEVARTIIKGTPDHVVNIIVVEGPSERHSSTNKTIGMLQITGSQIDRDLLKGTEIDLTVEISESRSLTVSAYLNGTGQDFSQVFSGTKRCVDARILATEILQLEDSIQREIKEADDNGSSEISLNLKRLLSELQQVIVDSSLLSDDDVTDDRFKIEDRKRKIAQGVYELTSSKRLDSAKQIYLKEKHSVSQLVSEHGNDREQHRLKELLGIEQTFINSTDPLKIENATAELNRIEWGILVRLPGFLVGMYEHLLERRPSMNDQIQASQLFELGKQHVENQRWDDLKVVNGRLWDLLPTKEQATDEMKIYTGIV